MTKDILTHEFERQAFQIFCGFVQVIVTHDRSNTNVYYLFLDVRRYKGQLTLEEQRNTSDNTG